MTDHDDPFAGLLRNRPINPALEADPPPSQMSEMPKGYVSKDDLPSNLNVKITVRQHRLAKENAAKRGLTLAEYIAELIERDGGR